jgi:hypothetical protein
LPVNKSSYPLTSAHALFEIGEANSCFDNDWPNFVPKEDLPAYPGGLSGYKVTPVATGTCVGFFCHGTK